MLRCFPKQGAALLLPASEVPQSGFSLDCLKIAQIVQQPVVAAVPSECFALLKEMVGLLIRKMSELLFKKYSSIALPCALLFHGV